MLITALKYPEWYNHIINMRNVNKLRNKIKHKKQSKNYN